MSEVSRFQRYGFELSNFGEATVGILMVEASIIKASSIIVDLLDGKLETDIINKELDWHRQSGLIIFQYQGHNWTTVFPFDICAEETVSQISELLEIRCIYLESEDTSSCSSYRLFNSGKCIEEFEWGVDYIEEAWGIETKDFYQFARKREAEGNPLPLKWNPKYWDIFYTNGFRSYKFRSNIRTTTKTAIIQVDQFLNNILFSLKAWLPNWEHLPGEELDKTQVKTTDFVRVDLICNAKADNEILNYLNNKLFESESN